MNRQLEDILYEARQGAADPKMIERIKAIFRDTIEKAKPDMNDLNDDDPFDAGYKNGIEWFKSNLLKEIKK